LFSITPTRRKRKRDDASELLDATKEALDQIAVLLDMAIEGTWVESVGARWNDSLAALRRDGFDKPKNLSYPTPFA